MKNFKLVLCVEVDKIYELEAEDRDDAEMKAIRKFQSEHPEIEINEDETYAQFLEVKDA